MLAKFPVGAQICGQGGEEADWECGTSSCGDYPVGRGEAKFVEGRWAAVTISRY